MKAVVTGSHGFIGKKLVDFLNSKEIEVFPLHHSKLHHEKDLREELTIIRPDIIFHFAAYGNHAHQSEVKGIFEGNIINTFNLLVAIKDLPIKGFVNVGSSSEYGKKGGPMAESDLPETDTLNGASKVATTYLSRAFAKQLNKPIVTIRPFSVFGEEEAHFRFIPRIIRSLLKSEQFELDPEPKHDWIYIQDFLNGVFFVLSNISSLQGEVINIGTGKQYSNLQVVRELETISKKILKTKILKNMRKYDNNNWICSNKKLKSLGWKQQFDLKRGLQETYKYYAKQRP